jgi:hypothetical protein
MGAFTGLQATLERGNALTVLLRGRGWRWTAGLIAVILSGPAVSMAITLLGQNRVPAVTNALGSGSVFLSLLTVMLKQGTSYLSSAIEKVEQAQFRLDAKRRAVEADFASQIAALERELAQLTSEYEQARTEEQAIARQIEELEQELLQVTPRRVLLDFVRERVGSEDYRKRLGVAALIRRDFDQLSRLIEAQNREFIEQDKGEEIEEGSPLMNRIVLYIDDLDRCPPKRVVEVLQAAHLLLAFRLFVVVVAVDARWLSQSLQQHYKSLLVGEAAEDGAGVQESARRPATPEAYLEKIFQIPFWIRPLTERARVRIVQGLVEESLGEPPKADEAAPGRPVRPREKGRIVQWDEGTPERAYEVDAESNYDPPSLKTEAIELDFMEDLKPLLGETPRSVKRFVNVYWLIKSTAMTQMANFVEDEDYASFKQVLFLLAVLTGLRPIWSDFRRLLSGGAHPTLGDVIEAVGEIVQDSTGEPRTSPEALAAFKLLNSWLSDYDNGSWLRLDSSKLAAWAPRVARFSFRMEEL